MKKMFYKMLENEDIILNENNKNTLINKFFVEKIDSKIDTISNNLIESCLSNMTVENSRKWLNRYLPIAFYQTL